MLSLKQDFADFCFLQYICMLFEIIISLLIISLIKLTFLCRIHMHHSSPTPENSVDFQVLMRNHLEAPRQKMSCEIRVHCRIPHCVLLVEVFAIPGEPCYQILKMLSSPPRRPNRATDRLSLTSSLTRTFPFTYSSLISNVRNFSAFRLFWLPKTCFFTLYFIHSCFQLHRTVHGNCYSKLSYVMLSLCKSWNQPVLLLCMEHISVSTLYPAFKADKTVWKYLRWQESPKVLAEKVKKI